MEGSSSKRSFSNDSSLLISPAAFTPTIFSNFDLFVFLFLSFLLFLFLLLLFNPEPALLSSDSGLETALLTSDFSQSLGLSVVFSALRTSSLALSSVEVSLVDPSENPALCLH